MSRLLNIVILLFLQNVTYSQDQFSRVMSSKETGSSATNKNAFIVNTTGQPVEISQELSKGAALLFGNVKTKLSVADKNKIYKGLGFFLAADGKQFTFGRDTEEYPFEAYVYPTDINKDGEEEYFILYGNTFTSGMTGSSVILFYKVNGAADYQADLGFPGTVPEILPTSNEGWPDLVIGGPGFEFPVWRWKSGAYDYFRVISDKELMEAKTQNVEEVSKDYQAK